jgi:hypothetical protein
MAGEEKEMNGYIGFYKGKRWEIYAKTVMEARNELAKAHKVKDPWHITIMLAEKDGETYTHLPLMNPKVNVDRLAIEAKKKYNDDVKAGHTDGVEYWAGYAGAAFLMSNPKKPGYYAIKRPTGQVRYFKTFGEAERAWTAGDALYIRRPDGWYFYTTAGSAGPLGSISNPGAAFLMSNPGGLGIAIANKAHLEGRRAFAAGVPEKNNPYDAKAAVDSDEWLRHQNWRNGWTFAWWNRKFTKYNRNPGGGAVRATPDTKMGQLVRMTKTHQATHFVYRQGRVLVDMQTANVLMKAYQALTDSNKARFERLLESWAGLRKLVDLSWKSTIRNPMKMMTAEIRKKLPKLYSQEKVDDPIAYVKFFTPWTNWTWWGLEFDGTDRFFGYVSGHEKELGYFSLRELESIRGPWGLRIERDLSFRPTPLSEIKRRHP